MAGQERTINWRESKSLRPRGIRRFFYKKAAQNNGKVVSANVSIHTSVCPECGRSYVSGGTTSTQIKYFNEDNPYQKDLKTADSIKYQGMNVDMAV